MYDQEDEIYDGQDTYLPQYARPRLNSLASYPASVQDHLAQAQEIYERGARGRDAALILERAGVELARASPEMFALSMAPQYGLSGIMFQDQFKEVVVTETEHRLLGLKLGSSVSVTTTTRMSGRKVGYY